MKDKIEIINGKEVVVSGECQGYRERDCRHVFVDGDRRMLLSPSEIDNLTDTEHSVEVRKPGEPTDEIIKKWISESDPNHRMVIESAKTFD